MLNKVKSDDNQTRSYLGPALALGLAGALLVQMHAFKKLGNLQRSPSVSTPALHSLIKTTAPPSRGWLKGTLGAIASPSFQRPADISKVICVYRRIAVVMDPADSWDDLTITAEMQKKAQSFRAEPLIV